MRPQLAALLLAVCCSGAALASAALYSDQAGLNEWHKELLGRVTHSSICSRRPRAFVATEQNVLASLHLRDGSILWRHLLGERDTVDELAYSEENRSVYTLHRRSATLRSWNSTHGSSLWELATPGSASDASAGSASALLLTDVNRDGIADVVVYFAGVVSAYHGLSGRQLWAFGESRPSDGAALVRAGDKLMAVAWSADETAATVLYASSGEVKATVDTTALAGSAVRGAAAAADTIVLMTEQQKLCVLDPVGQSATCTGVDELAPELQLQEGQLAQAASAAGHVVVTSAAPGRGAAVLKLAESRQLQLVRKLPGGAAGVSGVLDADGLEVAALLHRGEAEEEAGGQRLAVYSLETGEVVLEHAMPEELAAPRLLSVSFYRRREGGRGYRVLAQGRHLQLVLLQQGQPLWAREEALAMLRAVAFTDLPYLRPQEQADLDRQRHLGFLARIRMHLLRFKKQVKISTPAEDAALAQLQEALSDRNNPSRDKNGLRKQILALSAAGTMHSLLSSSGLQLWRTPLPEGAVPKAAERGDAALLPWRSSHDRYGHPQVAAVPMRAAGTAAVVQAHSGALLSSWEVAEPILQLFPLPPQRHGPLEEQHVYAAVVDAGGGRLRADVLPPSAAAAAADLPALHFWTVDAAAGRMQGYRLPRRAGDELEPTWTVVLPGAVLAATQRNPEEVLHSHVKVLGDQTIKFKFQSPNVVAVVCGLADEMVSDAVDIDSLTLTLLLLDTVTGRIIWQQSHPGARGPAHVVMLDNTAVAHYWSAANHRWEVTVLEMYDQSRSGTISVLDVVSGHAGSTNTSAFVYRPVEVLRQSFFARTGVRVMKPTQTALGVTNRHVLMGTVLDQVYSLDARLLNPRRPASKQLKPEERMEGLVPYSPNLGMNPLSFATYNRQVAGLRDIFTAPSVLESTGHMLAVGVDLFYSKLSPAGLFDSMHDDFPYAAIVITAAALLLGSSLLHWMAKNSALKQKWA